MGAWCGVGSRSDLRRRPRHRCAVATPVSPAPAIDDSRQTSRRRSAGRPVVGQPDDVGDVAQRRINDGNCPPVAHRLSRLGRNEFSGAASRSGQKFATGHRDGDVVSSATAPRGASPRASRRQSRRTRLAKATRISWEKGAGVTRPTPWRTSEPLHARTHAYARARERTHAYARVEHVVTAAVGVRERRLEVKG
ncbi:hypothetical protein X777_02438 [Ooceraea biroi]|uniref:Uncharacterized protein n=1 Tax=Ooceraea biroi TaxID=2015173 RepID=A0A026WN26_OOCBI|nr:hypothetical protein X777_02438 [Ooceraea biroi]